MQERKRSHRAAPGLSRHHAATGRSGPMPSVKPCTGTPRRDRRRRGGPGLPRTPSSPDIGRAFCSGQDLNERLDKDGKTDCTSAVPSIPITIRSSASCARYPFRLWPRSMAQPPAREPMSRWPAISCSRRAQPASHKLSFAIGLIPDCGGTWLLPRLVGPARARATGAHRRAVGAEKAEAWGLIWKAIDDGALLEEAHQALPAFHHRTCRCACADQARARGILEQ